MTTKYITFYGETFDTDEECILAEVNILEQYATIYDCDWDILSWETILKKYWQNNKGAAYRLPSGLFLRILPQTNTEFNEKYLASVRKYVRQILTDCFDYFDPEDIPTMSGTYEIIYKPAFNLIENKEKDVNG